MRSQRSCKDAREHFSAALDGELGGAEQATFVAHVGACGACSEAYDAYGRDLSVLTVSLHRLADAASPRLPFPQEPERGFQRFLTPFWLRRAGLTTAAFIGLLVGLKLPGAWAPGPTIHPDPLPSLVAVKVSPSAPEAPCPWRKATVREVERAVSYPVVTTECLDMDFELVEASVRDGRPCDDHVRLTYRAGARSLVLEQHSDDSQAGCKGESVVVDDAAPGCLERPAGGTTTSLRWSKEEQSFHLRGDVAPAEAIAVARSISRDLDRP